MNRILVLTIVFLALIIINTACSGSPLPIGEETLPVITTPTVSTEMVTAELPTPLPESTAIAPEYEECGTGEEVLVGFFTDIQGNNSPTQLVRIRYTDDNVRRYASVVSCLMFDEGWKSDPEEVVNGYENVIVFFDKYGVGHQYRIIIGGHYIAPWEPGRADIVSSLNGIDTRTYSVDGWIKATREKFTTSGVRQIGVDIYLEDTQGNLSKVFNKTFSFKEINLQIEQALKSGEGYPEIVPEGYFLFATQSWLIEPE